MEGVFTGSEEGERTPRGHRVLGELPQLEVAELTFAPGWEGVAPHTDWIEREMRR
ncbi:MAG TPA: hypothetical protein VE088_01035 [Gaiellaceae bacterium]|nr:hypothetical protein [Gaiellaceae bacterium]